MSIRGRAEARECRAEDRSCCDISEHPSPRARAPSYILLTPSFFVCIPAALLGAAWTYKLESEHHHHLEHLKEENGGQLPEIPKYEYLNIR